MNDKTKTDMKKIFKVIIVIVALSILAEVILYRAIVADRVNTMMYHTRNIDPEIIATHAQLSGKYAVSCEPGHDICLAIEKISFSKGNTLIDVLFTNNTAADIDCIEFTISSGKLTAKGKKLRDSGRDFSIEEFNSNDICTGCTRLDANCEGTAVEAHKSRQLQIVINGHVMSKDGLYRIGGIVKSLDSRLQKN